MSGKLKVMRWISSLLCAAVLITCIFFVKWGDLDPVRFLGLIAILAFFEAWQIQFPWGRPLRLGMAVALCVLAIRPLPEAVWIFFLGSIIGRLISRVRRDAEIDFFHIIQRTYIVALAGLVYMLLVNIGWDFTWNPYAVNFSLIPNKGEYLTYFNPVVLHRALAFPVAYIIMAAVFYAGEVVTSSLEMSFKQLGNWRVILPQNVRQTLPAYLAIAASGALMALYFPRIPWFNFLIFFFPLLLVRLESNRDKELDERYFETMRVIGDAFDAARGVPGHSSRVSNLAAEVARELGLPKDEARQVRYAAALHDIGRIEYPGDEEAPEHAERAAEVLEEIPRLRYLADIVRHHHPMAEMEGTLKLPMGSKIIGAVSDYDLLTSHPAKKVSSREALKEMSMERGRVYDSKVLRVLSQVVETQALARRRPEREISQKARVLEEEQLKESLEEIFREEE